MARKYKTLRFVGGLFKVLGWIFLVLGILSAIIAVVVMSVAGGRLSSEISDAVPIGVLGGVAGGVMTGIGLALAGVIEFVLFYAMGEGIDLAISIEQNTRESAYYLRGESNLPPPSSAF